MPDTDKKPYSGLLSAAIRTSARWILDTIPLALGIQKIPDLLPNTTGKNEIKLSLPSYCQTDTYSCGALAGWSVLKFLKSNANFKVFYEACAPDREYGTSNARLMAALRKHGVSVGDRKNLGFKTIHRCIRSGKPIPAAIAEGAIFDDDAAHWIVIYGVGTKPNRIFISGKTRPGFSRQQLTWHEFKSIWYPQGHGLVCSVKG